jgi:hypothetical protein
LVIEFVMLFFSFNPSNCLLLPLRVLCSIFIL